MLVHYTQKLSGETGEGNINEPDMMALFTDGSRVDGSSGPGINEDAKKSGLLSVRSVYIECLGTMILRVTKILIVLQW